MVFLLTIVIYWNDIGEKVLQFGDKLGFALEPFPKYRVMHRLRGKNFDRNFPIKAWIVGKEDCGNAAPA